MSKVPKEIQKDIIGLMNSCAEGHSGEWDCTTPEGREGFEAMYEALSHIAGYLKVDVSKVKDL